MKLDSTNMQRPQSFENYIFFNFSVEFLRNWKFPVVLQETLENAGMRNMDPNTPISPSYSILNQIIDLPSVKSRSFKLLELSILNHGNRLITLHFCDETKQ